MRSVTIHEAFTIWQANLARRVAAEAEYQQLFKEYEAAKQRIIEARGEADISRYALENLLLKEVSNEPS